MEEIKFINDLCCNYLTVRYIGEENDFALRMMTENVTDVFLALELRRLDGQVFLYYNISGMQNMEILYAERLIDRSVFQTFMWQLHEAIELSRELFLPGDGICLEPSNLFWDLGEERWKFIYVPGREKRAAEELRSEREKLAEFLVMHMDYEDRELTGIIYRFYEEISEGKISPGFFEMRIASAGTWEAEQEENLEEREEAGEIRAEDRDFEKSEEKEEEREPETENAYGNKKRSMALCSFLFAAAGAVLAAGWILRDVIIAAAGGSALLAAFLFAVSMRRKEQDESVGYIPEDIRYDKAGEEFIDIKYDDKKKYEEERAAGEKTVYVDIKKEQERKLYGIGKFRRQKISLDKLPCVVGKDKTLVNHIISDGSVSRMHARFFAEEETIWMQDLNSTNGTYHNGMRLSPNERVIVEPEDEIGFGQVQFVFR